ncbi:hypothetical protein NL676_015294 [Syzygium grande]|nr:hypothetical protein NL676_015294 [Syzygium grande]
MDAFSKLLALDGEARVNALGAVHKYGRGITLSHFSTESLKQGLLTQIEEIVGRTLSIWSNWESIEVWNSSASMIFKLNTKFMFGYNSAKSLGKSGRN